MFGNEQDVFANIPGDHHPDQSPPSTEPEAYTAAADLSAQRYAPPSHGGAGMSGQLEVLEPVDTSNGAAIRSAGITTLLAALAIGGGLAFGGPWGAVSGYAFSGGLANGYRAQKWWGSPDPSEKHEAVVSAIFAALGLAGGAYAAYQAYQARKDDDE